MFEKTKAAIVKNTIIQIHAFKKNPLCLKYPIKHERYSTLITGIKILLYLRDNYYTTIEDLAKFTGRCEKTVYRILAALDESGVPIIREIYDKNKVCYRISKSWFKK